MPTQHVAKLLGVTCCVRLANMLQHVAACRNPVAKRKQSVAICCVGMLRLFGRGFTPVKGENLQNYFGFAFWTVWVSR